jgi:HEPN domain-containing protein
LSNLGKKVDIVAIRDYWEAEAKDDLKVAEHLFEKGDYSYCLFFGHLAIEKLLKAIFVAKNKKHAPPIHNLVRLARKAHVEIDKESVDNLATITSFNIEARYPDMKRSFREKCNEEYTRHQFNKIKEIFAWLQLILTSKKA